ncbi:TPA: M24 family metallopeptidase [Candidatus Woesearchaeota archaeon]|nr:M24 family metallopeptidase [Candidatus Woesearchaeota archaeon]
MTGSAKILIASSTDSDMRYATKVVIPDPFIWIQFGTGKKTKEYIIVSSLEYSRAKEEAKPGTKIILLESIDLKNQRKPVGRRRNLADIAAAFLLSYNITEVFLPDNAWSLHTETLREHGLRVRFLESFFPERIVKLQEEVAAIKRAGRVAKRAMQHAADIIKTSTIEWDDTLTYEGERLTSERLKAEIEKIFIDNGCSSGETIVSCGEQAAQPHNRGSGAIYAGTTIVIDIFPRDNTSGYYFDMTRTFLKGTPAKNLLKLYDAVRKAQIAALMTVKPGRKASEIHTAAAAVFQRMGYKTTEEGGFIHSVGHGLGLDIHEDPGVGPRSDTILAPGMVITVEPGLYYKELGGVRIEDTVLVTKTGFANLTNVPKVFVVR